MMSPVFQAGKLPSSYDLVQFRYQCFGAILLVYPQAVHVLAAVPPVDSLVFYLLRNIMFVSWSSLSLS